MTSQEDSGKTACEILKVKSIRKGERSNTPSPQDVIKNVVRVANKITRSYVIRWIMNRM